MVWFGSLLTLVVVSGLLVSGCGGGTKTVTVTGSSAEASPEAAELQEKLDKELEEEEQQEAGEEVEGSGECHEKEISTGAHKEGTCTEEGTTWVVVNMHTPLKLETLEARLKGIQERKTIGGEFDSTTANGVFVTFTLAITNKGHAPAEFEEEQAVLYVNESIYTQDFEVQNGVEEQSFLWQGEEIQPGATLEGTATFDLPPKIAKKVTQEGNVDIANFGTEYFGDVEEFFELEEIGSIRTYQ